CQGQHGWATQDQEIIAALQARFDADPSTVHRVELPGASTGLFSVAAACPGVELEHDRWDAGVSELAQLIGVDRKRATWLDHELEHSGSSAVEFEPYRGLEAFRERDARWMFGRNKEIGELLALLRARGSAALSGQVISERVLGDGESRFLTVVGASGSGKSSLVMAGLCPMVRNGAMADGRTWEIGYLRPGARPCESLAHALLNLQGARTQDPIADGIQLGRLRDGLLDGDDTLRLVVSRIATSRLDSPGQIMLVVDQLEELFSEAKLGDNTDESSEPMAFVRNIVEATRSGGVLSVVATLRADFVHRCLEVEELAQAL